MVIEDLINSINSNTIRITDHADEEAQSDKLNLSEIIACVKKGEIIKQYPEDKPYPSCLVLGFNKKMNQFIVFGRITLKINGQY